MDILRRGQTAAGRDAALLQHPRRRDYDFWAVKNRGAARKRPGVSGGCQFACLVLPRKVPRESLFRKQRHVKRLSLYPCPRASEIWDNGLRYGQGSAARQERIGIFRTDVFGQRTFWDARQLCETLKRDLSHCGLKLPEALDGVPRHGERTWVLDVNIRLQH